MAELNMDCVRNLLLFIEQNQRYKENGRVVNIKMKHIRHQMEDWSYEDLYEAAKYICEEKLVTCVGGPQGKAPSQYIFDGITPLGHKTIAAMKDDTAWKKAKPNLLFFAHKGIDSLIQFLIASAVQ